jgi:hypothetical protein
MIRDALNPPGKTPHDKFKNYDGSNRFKIIKKYYDYNIIFNIKTMHNNNSYKILGLYT